MKKMRKLVPAFAMLMVAAIMLSTASFAWFTMNDEVTASGMEIKAKADGSLLISQAPLTADGNTAGAPDVTIDTGVQNLYPMAYNPADDATVQGATLSGLGDNGWYVPDDNKQNNIQTGLNSGSFKLLESADFANTAYYYVEEFYVATVDEAKTNATLQLDLSALSADGTNETWKAYAAAIYVVEKTNDEGEDPIWVDNQDVLYGATPDAIIFADTAIDDTQARGIVNLTGLNIPSVAGAVDGNTVGLKIIVHFYVDGALMSQTTTPVQSGSIYTQATGAYDATKSYIKVTADEVDEADVETGVTDVSDYYTLSNGVYTPATGVAVDNVTYFTLTTEKAVVDDQIIASGVPTDWYTATANIVQAPYAYVRTSDIPSTGTELELSFKLLAN